MSYFPAPCFLNPSQGLMMDSHGLGIPDEKVIEMNQTYLSQRCANLMVQLQGVLLGVAKKHVSKELESVAQNCTSKTSKGKCKNQPGLSQDPSQKLTKERISEMHFASEVTAAIIKRGIGKPLIPLQQDDSATEESEADDVDIVPKDFNRNGDENSSLDPSGYLPIESNPMAEALTLGKQYEARIAFLDSSISECEYGLSKSLAFKRYCKLRKPSFQLDKTSIYRGGPNTSVGTTSSLATSKCKGSDLATNCVPVSWGESFGNSIDLSQISSRCLPIKQLDKNRRVYQLGGTDHIRLVGQKPATLLCTCFEKDDTCAICLGRINNRKPNVTSCESTREKLEILDASFHKNLSFPEDIPLDTVLAAISVESNDKPLTEAQTLIKARTRVFPPELLATDSRSKKPRMYKTMPKKVRPKLPPEKDKQDIEMNAQPPKMDKQDNENEPLPKIPEKKKYTVRKPQSQESVDDQKLAEFVEKGLGLVNIKNKRTRSRDYDINNIVIPHEIAANTRTEYVICKNVETPNFKILEYDEIFADMSDEDASNDDMSDDAFRQRHEKCETKVQKKILSPVQKTPNPKRRGRRSDSAIRSAVCTSEKVDHKTGNNSPSLAAFDEGLAPINEDASLITEDVANNALKSLFRVTTKRRKLSSSTKEDVVEIREEADESTSVANVDPWAPRKFPLSDREYEEMQNEMEKFLSKNKLPILS